MEGKVFMKTIKSIGYGVCGGNLTYNGVLVPHCPNDINNSRYLIITDMDNEGFDFISLDEAEDILYYPKHTLYENTCGGKLSPLVGSFAKLKIHNNIAHGVIIDCEMDKAGNQYVHFLEMRHSVNNTLLTTVYRARLSMIDIVYDVDLVERKIVSL